MLYERHLPAELMLSRQGALKFKDTNKCLFYQLCTNVHPFSYSFNFIIQISNTQIAYLRYFIKYEGILFVRAYIGDMWIIAAW